MNGFNFTPETTGPVLATETDNCGGDARNRCHVIHKRDRAIGRVHDDAEIGNRVGLQVSAAVAGSLDAPLQDSVIVDPPSAGPSREAFFSAMKSKNANLIARR